MVNMDFLRFQKHKVRQPIQYAWCAATNKNFVGTSANKILRNEIVDLNIGALCEDIALEIMESQDGTRCTLYLLSMLCYGAVKLFKEQTNFLFDDCEKYLLGFIGGQELTQKKKKTKEQKIPEMHIEEDTVSSSPIRKPTFDIVKIFEKNRVVDLHLMSEIDDVEILERSETFGFDPNETVLDDSHIAQFCGAMLGEDPPHMNADHMPQDNALFAMNNESMHAEPADNLIEMQQSPNYDPQLQLNAMTTPKRYATRSRKAMPSENAHTAHSPPKKRSRVSNLFQDQDIDDMMIASEPPREACLPDEQPRDAGVIASPIFEFKKRYRRHNMSLPLRKNVAKVMEQFYVTAALDEPVLDVPIQHASPPHPDPVVEPQIDLPERPFVEPPVALPEVSFVELPPLTVQPEDNAQTHSSNIPHRASPSQAALPSANNSARIFVTATPKASDISLLTLRSFEENSRIKYVKRGKKIFADRIKQIENVSRPADFMTITYVETLFIHALRQETVTSLFENPATMKRDKFLSVNRHWANDLLETYRLRMFVPPKKKVRVQKRKKGGDESRQSSQENREERIENIENVQEQHQTSPPNNIVAHEHDVEVHRADMIPEDNANMETFLPNAPVATGDVPAESPEHQIVNNIISEAARQFEEGPIEEPLIVQLPLPEVTDQVETVMSPTKRFKSRDDRDLQDVEKRSGKDWSADDVLEIIQSYWGKCTQRDIERHGFIFAEFGEIIKSGSQNSVVVVGNVLQRCFVLENTCKLYIKQQKPYDIIYLIKW